MSANTTAKAQDRSQANQHRLLIHGPDGPKPAGTVNTANAPKTNVVSGLAVLCSAWAIAQLGWIAGPTVILFFAFVTYNTSTLLAECDGSCHPVSGERNSTHTAVAQSNLSGVEKVRKLILCLKLFGDAIGYTIAASTSMMAIIRSNCFHASGGKNPYRISINPYMIDFGVAQAIFSLLPDFNQIWWLSIVSAVMSFTYSTIGLGLGIAKVAETENFKGSLTGISGGTVTEAQKIWRTFQALGDIAFAYSYAVLPIQIQDITRPRQMESKTMKKASLISVSVTTIFYMLCGCFGYAAFGDLSPGNLLTGFDFYNLYWLLSIANAAVVIHVVAAYQVDCRPLFALVEEKLFQKSESYKLILFKLVWRTIFVIVITVISMLMPFLNDVVWILGAFGFWPLTVYFSVKMYIAQKKITKWSTKWVRLQTVSIACLVISITAASGSIARIVLDLKSYKPFSASYE